MRSRHRLAVAVGWFAALLASCASDRDPPVRTRGGDAARGGAAIAEPIVHPRAPGTSVAEHRDFHSDRGIAEKLALLVGIDEYAPGTPAGFKKLTGCVRDTELVRRVIESRFEFPPADVLVLTNAEATHENIVRAFHDWLIARAGPETEVLFWFSGHGSRIPDTSGVAAAEQGGKDSTFLAYDSRSGGEDGAFDVSDDELRSLLGALTQKTARVTIVTDSCHSGGGTRGVHRAGEPRIRAADEGSRPLDFARIRSSFWPADVPLRDDGAAVEIEPARYVHIAACGNTQVAQEIDTLAEDGTVLPNGALTLFLTECMQTAQPSTSYRSLSDQAAVRLATEIPAQTLWREGALDRQMFGARFRERPAGFLARSLSAEEIQVEAGTMLGLRTDSSLAVYDALGTQILGHALVVRSGAQSCTARWAEAPPADALRGALRAVEETRPFGSEPLAVHFDDAERAARFEHSARIRAQSGVPQSPDLLLRVDRDGERLELCTSEGLRLWHEKDPTQRANAEFVSSLEEEFREELRYRALLDLALEPGSLPIRARFEPPTEADLESFRATSRHSSVLDASPRTIAAAGGVEYSAIGGLGTELRLAVLVVENPTAREVYLSVLSVAEDRGRNLIWPNAGQQDNVVPAGGSQRMFVNVTRAAQWDLPRPMRDRYLVIATNESADFTPLTRVALVRGGPEQPNGVRMPEMLSLALEKPPTRGVKSAKLDRQSFGITTVDLLVAPPTSH